MTQADFAPLSDADWPREIADMRDGFAGQLNVYRVMAHHPALLRAWADLRRHIVTRTALGPERAEVAILRLAHRLGSSYEWNQHVIRGLDVGLTRPRIAALAGPVAGMQPDDALLAQAVDALFDHAELSPGQLAALEDQLGREAVLDLLATAGMYLTLGFILKTTGAPLDDNIAQALAQRAPELMR
ncbi:MAG: carboxymuconolactone decarboxylase family protein [Rhodobacteraceae bacterium]|nr:carboxymuconolactone decarboxylase family protein [Paracoccaceae bacterium]